MNEQAEPTPHATAPQAATPAAAVTTSPAAVPVRRWRRVLLWLFGPTVLVATAAWLYLSGGRYVGTDNAYVQADRIHIAPQIAGRVVEVLVRENQPVQAGDVLFRIDPAPLQIAVDRAEAQLAALGDMLTASRDDVQSAMAKLKSSDAGLRWNQQVYDRQRELKARGLVPQQSLDAAVHELASSQADREAAQASLARATSMIGGNVHIDVSELPAYKAGLAQLAQARLDLEHAIVRAPVDGIVGKEDLQVGEFLAIGQAAMPLIATGQMWVEANFKETDLTAVQVGQAAEVRIDTYPGRRFHAHVASISPASGAVYSVLPAQNATGNWVKVVQRIPVRLVIDEALDPQAVLRAGMSAEAEIDTGAANARGARFWGAPAAQAEVASNHG